MLNLLVFIQNKIYSKMTKLFKHKWIRQNGFRIHKCEHCNVIRYWDDSFKRIMYKTKFKIWYYEMPKCKRIMHCDKIDQDNVLIEWPAIGQFKIKQPIKKDKIDLNEIGTDWNNGEFYK